MFAYTLLKNHAGLLLISDYTSLRWLHEVVHDLNERSPIVKNREGPFMSFAYEVRKAYEREREIVPHPQHYEEIGTRFGFRVLWPVLLMQTRMMRASLGFVDSDARAQCVTYGLEYIIEGGLTADFGAQAPDIIEEWKHLHPTSPDYFGRLDSRGKLFSSWSKAERKRRLAKLLRSFHWSYDKGYEHTDRDRKEGYIAPDELRGWEAADWPDPRW